MRQVTENIGLTFEEDGLQKFSYTKDIKENLEKVDQSVGAQQAQLNDIAKYKSNWINAVENGIDNTGQNDCSVALQNILDQMTNGGTVYFPRGTYLFSNAVNVPSHVSLIGENRDSTIFTRNNGTSILKLIGIPKSLNMPNARNVEVRINDIGFFTNDIVSDNALVWCEAISYLTIYHCKFSGHGNHMLLWEAFDSRIIDTPFITGGESSETTTKSCVNIRSFGVNSQGYEMEKTNQIIFDACRFEYYYSYAILDDSVEQGCNNMVFSNCKFESTVCKTEHIYLSKDCTSWYVDNTYFCSFNNADKPMLRVDGEVSRCNFNFYMTKQYLSSSPTTTVSNPYILFNAVTTLCTINIRMTISSSLTMSGDCIKVYNNDFTLFYSNNEINIRRMSGLTFGLEREYLMGGDVLVKSGARLMSSGNSVCTLNPDNMTLWQKLYMPALDTPPTGTDANQVLYMTKLIDGASRLFCMGLTNNNTLRFTRRSTIPASGTWERGDIIFNSQPTAGGYEGWICVTAGTPGVWKGYGSIEV